MRDERDAAASRGATVGVLLAAGAGTRFGGPKALARAADGTPWLHSAASALLDGGCARLAVVLGASAAEAAALVPADPRVSIVVASSWQEGMGASLRAGVLHWQTVAPEEVTALAVSLVDLPGLPAEVVRRIVADVAPDALRQAVYLGRPGHPVLVGRAHWPAFAASLRGDQGGRPYLLAQDVEQIDCSALWDGADVDRRG